MTDTIIHFIGWLTVALVAGSLVFWAALTALDKPDADLAIVEKVAFLAGVLAFLVLALFPPYPEVWFYE